MGVLLPWFVAAGFQTVRDVRVFHRPPAPGEFLASGIVFGALALLSQANERLATVLGWGYLLAIVLKAGGPQALAGVPEPAQRRPPRQGQDHERPRPGGSGGHRR